MRHRLTSLLGISFSVKPPTVASLNSSVVVFVHGNGLCKEVFDPVADHLTHEWTVQVDLTGHGSSRKAPPQFKTEDYGHDVISALDAFRMEFADRNVNSIPTLACSHSMGSTSTMWAMLHRPGVFRHAFLFEPILHPPVVHNEKLENDLSKMAKRRNRVFNQVQDARKAWRHRGVFKTWVDEAFEGYLQGALRHNRETLKYELSCDPEWEAINYSRDFSDLWLKAPSHRPWPCTLIHGELATTYDYLKAFRNTNHFMNNLLEFLAAEGLVVVPETTHSMPMEQPKVLADMVIAKARQPTRG